MRVLMVSKACLVGTYQSKLAAIAAYPDVELGVLIPPEWRDPAGTIRFEPLHTDGYTLWVDPIRFNGNYHLHYYPTLARRIAIFQPDIIHMDEEPYNLATWLALNTARRAGCRFLFFTWQNLHRRYPIPFRWMEQQVLNRADYGIMGNREAVSVFKKKGFNRPHEILPQFGTSPEHFRPASGRETAAKTSPVVIGFAGRLIEEKGIDLLIEAAARLPKEGWLLRIAGDGPQRDGLTADAEARGLGGKIDFVGPLPSAEMPEFLQSLDILVLPSRTRPNWKEQFGRILIEAMATELAVVGSDSGEIPNVIGEGGMVFREDDAAQLSEILNRLIHSQPLRKSLGEKGRKRVLHHYTQSKIAAETVSIYRKLLKTGSET